MCIMGIYFDEGQRAICFKNKQIEVLYENIIILSTFQLTLVIMGNRFNPPPPHIFLVSFTS